MKLLLLFITLVLFLASCTKPSSNSGGAAPPPTGWETTKSQQIPTNMLPAEYQTPTRQTTASLAWEDGVYISRDGLSLYAFYQQFDALKAISDGASIDKWPLYLRGPDIGQDYTNPIPPNTFKWLHADIAMSHRASVNDSFPAWQLSNLHGQTYNLGAPQAIVNASDPTKYDFVVYTNDSSGSTKIYYLTNVGRNLAAHAGNLVSSTVNEVSYNEDNPHAERYDIVNPNKIVLMWDSDNKPGLGDRDIWFSTSADGGGTWTVPSNVSTINTAQYDAQPHLFNDGTDWWLYWSGTEPSGKSGIYRAKQTTLNNWNSWGTKQLVISAGAAASIGEPSLSSTGDISFCVVTHNTINGTQYDAYDNDPWIMKKK